MLFLLPFVHGIVEVSSTSNQSAYSVILGLGHTVLYTDLVVQENTRAAGTYVIGEPHNLFRENL